MQRVVKKAEVGAAAAVEASARAKAAAAAAFRQWGAEVGMAEGATPESACHQRASKQVATSSNR